MNKKSKSTSILKKTLSSLREEITPGRMNLTQAEVARCPARKHQDYHQQQ